ncbi:MAG: cob(I)yrinic acid a,c-diamide adenosyltransferase [Candidatus Micrarchaeia archaeon]
MARKHGLVHVLTGDGNGKTTSAIGIAVRASSRGMKVAFVQFLKGGLSSEVPALEKLGVTVVSRTKHCAKQREHEAQLNEKGDITFCRGCFAINGMDRLLVAAAFEKAKRMCAGGEYGLVVLDEIFWAMKEGLVNEADVLALMKTRAQNCELVLTGRGATRAIEEAADYVTYVSKGKHPFDSGVLSRCGVDY